MSRPAWARWVTRISLAIGLVALAFTVHSIGPRNIGRYFERIGWWWFAVVALFTASGSGVLAVMNGGKDMGARRLTWPRLWLLNSMVTG